MTTPIATLLADAVQAHTSALQRLLQDQRTMFTLETAANAIFTALCDGKQLFLCGNGGSAADAQHIAAELVGRFLKNRKPLNAQALSTDTSVLTALGNDFGYEQIFARQVEAKAKTGDVVLGITTSGSSQNVVLALQAAKAAGATAICLMGNREKAPAEAAADIAIKVPSSETPVIQELHMLVYHVLCDYIEREIGE